MKKGLVSVVLMSFAMASVAFADDAATTGNTAAPSEQSAPVVKKHSVKKNMKKKKAKGHGKGHEATAPAAPAAPADTQPAAPHNP